MPRRVPVTRRNERMRKKTYGSSIAQAGKNAGEGEDALRGSGPYPGSEPGKQLSGQVAGAGGVFDIFPADIVIQDSSLSGLVDLGQCQIHAVTLNGACD